MQDNAVRGNGVNYGLIFKIALALVFAASALAGLNAWRALSAAHIIVPGAPALDKLALEATTLCAKNGFKGSIAELSRADGPVQDGLSGMLAQEINTRLIAAQDSPLTTIVPPQEYEARIKQLKTALAERGVPQERIVQIVMERAGKAAKVPDYETALSWNWEQRERGLVRVTLKISGKESVEVTALFTHPDFIMGEQHKIAELRTSLFRYSLLAIVALAGLLVLLLRSAQESRTVRTNWPQTVAGLERLVTTGSFFAAFSETKRLLAIRPDNAELLALRERILHTTKNNPREADKAYVRFTNLRAAIEGKGLLFAAEYEELKALSQKLELPDIAHYIASYESRHGAALAAERLAGQSQRIAQLLNDGELDKAEAEYKDLASSEDYMKQSKSTPENGQLLIAGPGGEDLGTTIARSKNEAAKTMDRGIEELRLGHATAAEEALKKAYAADKSLSRAKALIDNLQKIHRTETLRLLPKKTGKEIIIFRKDTLLIGREAGDIVVPHPKVSRTHCRITQVADKFIVEDIGSGNGTFLAGERISRAQIHTGDVVRLGQVYEMTAHFTRRTGAVSANGTILDGMTAAAGPSVPASGMCLEAKDRDYVLLTGSLPLSCKAVGLIYEADGNCSFSVDGDAVFFRSPEGCQLLYPGGELSCKGISYEVALS